MKKYYLPLVIAFTIPFTLMAQNSLRANYGIALPKGETLRDAFQPSTSIGISFLHGVSNAKWYYGGTISHVALTSKDDFFKDSYNTKINLTNYLFSLRKDFKIKEEHKWYIGLDAGLNHHVQKTRKNTLVSDAHHTGFTTGVVLGTDWYISRQCSFLIEGNYTRCYTGTINYNDQFSSSSLKYYGVSLGLVYHFSK
ncbi:MAG TPA: hypothetical protein VJ499_03595 [Flavisolibacter sp.]|nr:hypothetical protein [Flavisolibacter sp.]